MMAREEYIRIYRSSVPGATPSLTSGEIAANLVDGKLFVGATNADGSLRNVVFNDVRASVTGIAAGHGLSASGSTGTITLFNMGVTGANVGYGLVSLTGSQTGTVSFAVAGLTTTSSLDSLSVQGNDLYLSLGQHINLIRHSQDFVSGASDWSTYNGIAAPTNIGTDNTKGWPGGATGGISITFQSNSNNGIYQVWPTGSLEKNTSYTVSCWARSNTGTEKCRLSYYDDQPGGQISYFSDDFNLTTTPQRVAFTFTTLSNNTVSNVAFGNGSGNAAGTVLAWGFQLERGRFATDPIRTFGATGASTPRILQVNSGVTGVVAGHGLSASGSTGTITLYNMGVTSFNGLTGTVNYYPPFATDSVTGVASFNLTDFGVVSGAVSLKNAVKNIAVGASSFTGTVSITNGSNVTISTANNRITISSSFSVGATGNTLVSGIAAGVSSIAGNTIAINNLGVTSFNGVTGAINYYPPIANSSGTGVAYFRPGDFNVSGTGAVTLDSAVVKGATGNTVLGTGAITIDTSAGGNIRTVTVRNATDSLTGVASFLPTFFSIANGAVSLSGAYASTLTGDTISGVGAISVNTLAGNNKEVRVRLADNSLTGVAAFDSKDFGVVSGVVSSRGVTGISAGNTGIAIDGPTGEVVILNMGVLSFNGSTGHVSVSIGQTVTGDGGALIGANNSLITARLAETGKTGVASFNSTHFTVNNAGSVSLNAPYTITGNTLVSGIAAGVSSIAGNTVAINNLGVTGIEVAANHGLSASGITGTITLRNMGVTGVSANTNSGITISGTTGHVVFALANTGFSLRDDSQQSSTVSLGDTLTITGGTGVVFRKTSEDNYAIYSNFTINGAPPNGNDFTVQTDGKLSIPFATSSVTGVASFPLADFGVSITGEVSLTGNVARKNTAQTFTGLQTFATGISATTGSTIVGHFFSKNDTLNSYITFPGYLVAAAQGYHYFRAGRSNGGTGDQFGEFRFGAPTADSIDNYASHWMSIGRNSNASISQFLAVNGIISSKEQGSTAWDSANIVVVSRDDIVNSWAFTVQGTESDVNYFGINSFGGISSAAGATFRDSVHAPNVFAKNILNSIAVGASSFTGAVSITNGSNVTISTANNQITISSSFSVGATGNTLVSGIAAGVSAVAGNTIAINNLGVTSFNGATGAVNYYPPFATDSVTGVASFNLTDFGVVSGAVSLKNAVKNVAVGASSFTGAVSITNGSNVTISTANNRITISSSFSVGATGDTVGATGALTANTVSGVRLLDARLATSTATGVASFNSTDFTVASGAVRIKGAVTSLNGLTGAVTLTGDGGAVRGVSNTAITARLGTPCGTTGVVGVKCGSPIQVDVNGLIYLASGDPCTECQANSTEGTCEGAGCYWCACNSTCYCSAEASLCPFCFETQSGTAKGFFNYPYSGYGVSANNGAVSYIYLDASNLTGYAGNFTSKTDNYVLFFDGNETGLVKTKKASLKTFFLNNLDTLLESKTTSQFSRTKGGDSIEFRAVLGNIQAGEEGLIKGASAFDYIESNTVKAINGCTGGTFSITGTEQEVTVTTGINCRQIVIGLPDSVRIPHISGTGGTFSETITANKFVGSINGGLF